MALNQWGQVFSWGSDLFGQCGHQLGNNIQTTPKIIKGLTIAHIVQIACGDKHSVALSNSKLLIFLIIFFTKYFCKNFDENDPSIIISDGDIYTWGANNYGQLGLGTTTPYESKPQVINSLLGIPIAFIACGGNHTFAISKSGAVFGWGKNTMGQLGINDVVSKSFPCQLRTLRNMRVRYISCGDDFTTFLTLDGGVLTCGAGMYGQLGHGNNSNEILPRQVSLLFLICYCL